MLEVPIASEVCNLVNFMLLDIAVLSLTMVLSGKLAGQANHATLKRSSRVQLANFDLPLIGGGLVMQRGRRRNVLILLRVSVVAAVAVCNFGLEGRSRVRYEHREVAVRGPSNVSYTFDAAIDIVRATEPAMRCGRPGGNSSIVFGALLDGKCYDERTDFVYIRRVSMEESAMLVKDIAISNCSAKARCDDGFFTETVLWCHEAELVCRGVEQTAECDGNGVNLRRCSGVVYDKVHGVAYLCEFLPLEPSVSHVFCQQMQVKREHASGWTQFSSVTGDLVHAVFAAAYALETRKLVTLPAKEEAITVVRLWWFLPAGWVATVTFGLGIWWIVDLIRGNGAAPHDERGLTLLIGQQLVREHALDSIQGAGSHTVL